jgi:hypothetical protein
MAAGSAMGGPRHASEGDRKGTDRNDQTSNGGAQRRIGVAARGIGGERLHRRRGCGASHQDAPDGRPHGAAFASSRQWRGRSSASCAAHAHARTTQARQEVTPAAGRRRGRPHRRGSPERTETSAATPGASRIRAWPTRAEPEQRRGAHQVWMGAPAHFRRANSALKQTLIAIHYGFVRAGLRHHGRIRDERQERFPR